MNIKNIQLASLSAIIIGAINLASMGIVFAVYNSTRQSKDPESSQTVATTTTITSSDVDSATSTDTATTTDPSAPGTTATTTGTATTAPGQTTGGSTTKAPTVSGGTAKPQTGGTTGGGGAAPVAESASLKKGAPCATQTPPAGVCKSILSFNSKKDGNPDWNPAFMQTLKDNVYKEASPFGSAAWSAIKLTLVENTWKGNATRGSMTAKLGAAGRTGDIILQVDWNGSQWIVTTALGGGEN